jgi:hypothetical protein
VFVVLFCVVLSRSGGACDDVAFPRGSEFFVLDAINPFSVTKYVKPALAGFSQMFEGFSSALAEKESAPAIPQTSSNTELSGGIMERLQKILQKLGIDPNKNMKIEVDAKGGAWVLEGDPAKRGEVEMAITSDAELVDQLGQWAVRYGPPEGSAILDWPLNKQ